MNSNVTEAQQIEIRRRLDVMHSLIPIARQLLLVRSQIREQLAELNKLNRKLIIYGVMLFGGVWHWISSGDNGFSINIGAFILISAGLFWYGDGERIRDLEQKDAHYGDILMGLSTTWLSVTTRDTFLQIRGFVNEFGAISDDDDGFRQWILEAREAINYRVVGE